MTCDDVPRVFPVLDDEIANGDVSAAASWLASIDDFDGGFIINVQWCRFGLCKAKFVQDSA